MKSDPEKTMANPEVLKSFSNSFTSVLFLPENENRYGEGGLRTQGYFKKSKQNLPLISVITVVYNGEKYIEQTIKSVVEQTYSNIEYIIVDGGSTDDTLNIIKKYEPVIDYWVSECDNGIYDAMNKGIRLCKGEAVKLINSDDMLKIDSLEKCVKVFNDNRDGIFVINGYIDRIDADGRSLAVWTNKNKIINNYNVFNHPSWFVPSSVYKQYGLYNTEYKISSDYEYYLRLKKNNVAFITIKEPLVLFRLGGISYGLESLKEDLRINKIYAKAHVAYYDYIKRAVLKFLQRIKYRIL